MQMPVPSIIHTPVPPITPQPIIQNNPLMYHQPIPIAYPPHPYGGGYVAPPIHIPIPVPHQNPIIQPQLLPALAV